MLEALCASRRMPRLIFLHVPKTGGTTVRKIVQREFEPSEIFELYGGNVEDRVRQYGRLTEVARSRVRIVSGHAFHGIHEDLRETPTYVTMLREPVQRVISIYHHRYNFPPPGFERMKTEGMDPERFIEEFRLTAADNGQTRVLSGATNVPFGECTREMLERAKQNIRDHFTLVMLTERFDESVLLLRRMFGWKIPCYVRENVSKKHFRGRGRSSSAIRAIERHNGLDAELYAFARELFQQMIEIQGESFVRELKEFRLINASVEAWMEPEVVWARRLAREAAAGEAAVGA